MVFRLFLFFLCMPLFSFAQLKGAVKQENVPAEAKLERKATPTNPKDVAKEKSDKMKNSLKLSDKQYKDVYAIYLDYETKLDIIHKGKQPKAKKFKEMNVLNKEKQKKLEASLTKEQYHSYIMSFP